MTPKVRLAWVQLNVEINAHPVKSSDMPLVIVTVYSTATGTTCLAHVPADHQALLRNILRRYQYHNLPVDDGRYVVEVAIPADKLPRHIVDDIEKCVPPGLHKEISYSYYIGELQGKERRQIHIAYLSSEGYEQGRVETSGSLLLIEHGRHFKPDDPTFWEAFARRMAGTGLCTEVKSYDGYLIAQLYPHVAATPEPAFIRLASCYPLE